MKYKYSILILIFYSLLSSLAFADNNTLYELRSHKPAKRLFSIDPSAMMITTDETGTSVHLQGAGLSPPVVIQFDYTNIFSTLNRLTHPLSTIGMPDSVGDTLNSTRGQALIDFLKSDRSGNFNLLTSPVDQYSNTPASSCLVYDKKRDLKLPLAQFLDNYLKYGSKQATTNIPNTAIYGRRSKATTTMEPSVILPHDQAAGASTAK